MKINFKNVLFLIIFSLLFNCARKGRPEGGPKDENAPILVTAVPPYETTHFNQDNIRIYFDEYITLKDLNKQLVVSPPMKTTPLITPQGSPSKYINIKILDTLLQNTTYIFNFGNAVQDNNEGNKIESFKYVFSTGDYIDSLFLRGSVKDVLFKKTPKNTSILLYKADSVYHDSIVYKQKPNYVTSTLDTTNFTFSNLKKGNYFVIALQEESKDYLYNPKSDKIGFLKNSISLPNDSVLVDKLMLFKEVQPYKFKKGKETSKGKIVFGFTGERKNFKIKLLSKTPKNFKSTFLLEKDKDTINYWFTPFEADSLNFIISNNNVIDSVTVKLRKKKIDSLVVNTTISRTLHTKDTFFLKTNNPIITVDTSKIKLYDKDSLKVSYKKLLVKNKIAILFNKKEKENYRLELLPKAFKDIYSMYNDTLKYRFRTLGKDDYGKIILTIERKGTDNLIIELLNKNEKLIRKKFITSTEIKDVIFDFLPPQKYLMRVIVDENKNFKWDTGNYLEKLQPEKIEYFPKTIVLRANYFEYETFILKK